MIRPLALSLVAAAAVGCGASPGPLAVPTTAEGALGARPACKVTASHHKPLVVDWAQDERADLEAELRQKHRLLVVAYDCNTLRLLPECRLDGEYGYTGVTKKVTVQHFEGALEIALNLPLNGLGIAGQLGVKADRDAALDLALVTIGQRRSTRTTATRDDLAGACAGATHFVRGVQLGAFALGRAERGHTEAAATIFSSAQSGRTSDAHRASISDGSVDSCNGDVEAAAPPAQCGAPLRVELVAIGAGSGARPAPAAEEPAACPDGATWTGDKCAPVATSCSPAATDACAAECEQRKPESCLTLARALDKTDAKRALSAYERGCDAGSLAACNGLGASYGRGDGVARDDAKAVEIYKRACDQGFSLSCVNLGAMHYAGTGVPKNEGLATRLWLRACEAGEGHGCLNVSVAYGDGQGVPKDPARAFAFAERACTGGVPRGCALAAWATLTGDGATKDVKGSLARLESLCAANEASACIRLMGAYVKGLPPDVPADPLRVREYAGKACSAGAKDACEANKLLGAVDSGDTTVAQVNAMFEKQCSDGSMLGCALLGENLVTGAGLPADRARGIQLLKKACAAKVERACQRLAQLKP